jgi:hypothetical protein
MKALLEHFSLTFVVASEMQGILSMWQLEIFPEKKKLRFESIIGWHNSTVSQGIINI